LEADVDNHYKYRMRVERLLKQATEALTLAISVGRHFWLTTAPLQNLSIRGFWLIEQGCWSEGWPLAHTQNRHEQRGNLE
jgi:hypothetical protein